MTATTVSQFADELKMPVAALLEQLDKAGVGKQGERDSLTDQDKTKLLDYLRRAHGEGAKTKITLTRKQTSEIKATDAQGRARTVQVEVRKKRVLVKREAGELAADAPVEAIEPVVPVEPVAAVEVIEEVKPVKSATPVRKSVIGEDEMRVREEEERGQQALLERQARELKEKQERET
ncbi:MAG: translation initiation factor IF-2 associated domain-containing protein, partial [Betaproteobacteria bacterium]